MTSVVALCVVAACGRGDARVGPSPESLAIGRGGGPTPADEGSVADVDALRERLIDDLAAEEHDVRVLAAVRAVPRDRFADASPRSAWSDRPLTDARGAVAEPPSVVAAIARALELHGHERVLVVGAGTGYEVAILARLGGRVDVIEPDLARAIATRRRLEDLGLQAKVRVADARTVRPDAASFDRVVILTAMRAIPEPLLDAARSGGIVVATIGSAAGPRRLLRARRVGSLVLPEDLGPLEGRPELTSPSKSPAPR